MKTETRWIDGEAHDCAGGTDCRVCLDCDGNYLSAHRATHPAALLCPACCGCNGRKPGCEVCDFGWQDRATL